MEPDVLKRLSHMKYHHYQEEKMKIRIFTDRIELFIAGREFANFFCELNDPIDSRRKV
jgi:Lysyl-tRNA synthetase (class II)